MKINRKKYLGVFLTLILTALFTYGQIPTLQTIDSLNAGKKSCNLNKSQDKERESNICNGSICEWTSGWQGTNFGKCG